MDMQSKPAATQIIPHPVKHPPISFKAKLMEKYSSFHQLSILSLLGMKTDKSPYLSIIFNFNLHTAIPPTARSHIIVNVCDDNMKTADNTADFSIKNLIRWRLNISSYESFLAFLESVSQSQRKKYYQTQNAFQEYGTSISWIEDDWSQYVEKVYELYYNVAKRHGGVLYDLDFFYQIAKQPQYKLMCVWHEESVISALVMIDEEPVFHSMVCGLDYDYSQKTRAYSLMHYEIIRYAINNRKYTIVDIGMTGDKLKAIMGYKPISVHMQVSSPHFIIRGLLRILSLFFKPTINSNAALEMKFAWRRT
jgi:predicted N-acyltransferase